MFKYLSEYYPIKLRTSEQGQLDVDAEETRRALLGGESLTLAPNATSGRHGD